MCTLEPSKPSPHPTCILSIECKLPPVMSLRLNAQMCTRINITGAPIPKQYTPPAYINTQMHPNKQNQVCFREARKMVRRHVHWLWDADGNTIRRYIFLLQLAGNRGTRALALMRRRRPITNTATVRPSLRPAARAGPQMLPR